MNTKTNFSSFEKGALWDRILETTGVALEHGALKPIKTEGRVMEDGGVDFLVRVVESLARKEADKILQTKRSKEKREKPNPFLPYEKDMFVADISNTHRCLLNKFNVIEHHLLIVTNTFEHQETLLTVRDFQAIWRCMTEFEGLAFYNGGKIAGASQGHKHLQLIPLPMASTGRAVPMESLFEQPRKTPGVIPELPFVHAFKRFSSITNVPLVMAAQALHQMYRLMLQQVGMNPFTERKEALQSGPYNLLFTREWMLLIPRSREFFESISVNALGFAGAMLARNPKEMALIEKKGGMGVLKHTTIARS
ncbi:MAG: phosphorylase [Deltaproteobacteria bacterium]|nr:phosphorylase [Deltaproteobacteria bacterium]